MFLLEYLIFSQQPLMNQNYVTINGQLYCKSTIVLPSCRPPLLGHGQKITLNALMERNTTFAHLSFLFSCNVPIATQPKHAIPKLDSINSHN